MPTRSALSTRRPTTRARRPPRGSGAEDDTYELLEGWASVAPHLERLPERERQILYFRFFRGLTQSQIADKLGISQMHVSRILSRTLSALREAVGALEG